MRYFPNLLLPGLLLANLLMLLPHNASAEIYRCVSRGDTYFSQIPCNDNAQEVVIEDRQMFSAMTVPADPAPAAGQPAKAQVRTTADNLREFVETLHRQRSDQMAAVDRDIGEVESQLAATEGRPADDPERQALGEKLTTLNASRVSIADQYESMITEAERRVAELSSGGKVMAKATAGDG